MFPEFGLAGVKVWSPDLATIVRIVKASLVLVFLSIVGFIILACYREDLAAVMLRRDADRQQDDRGVIYRSSSESGLTFKEFGAHTTTQLHPLRNVEESNAPVPRRRRVPVKPPPPVFEIVVARWAGAETSDMQLSVLEILGKHRPTTLPEAVDVGSTWQGWLRCEWELPSVVREMRESPSSEAKLESFVKITGSRGNMECSTCAQFLEKEWGESGTRALEVLSRGVSFLDHGATSFSGANPNQEEEIHATETHFLVKVGEDQPDAQSFIDAIVWACTAIRINALRKETADKRSQLEMSKATQLLYIPGPQSQALVYGLNPLKECSYKDLGTQSRCWASLFRSGIVAFHSLRLQWGPGLKISFDMMIHLSGVENVYHIDGGIILIGFFTALVPISYDEDIKMVRWHFEEVNPSKGLLRPCSISSVRFGKWYKTEDVKILRSSRCSLGWFERANILLGTRQLVADSQSTLKWSTETKEHHQSAHQEGYEAGGQLGFTAGPINTNLQLVSTYRFHSNI